MDTLFILIHKLYKILNETDFAKYFMSKMLTTEFSNYFITKYLYKWNYNKEKLDLFLFISVLKGHGDLDQGHLTNAHHQGALVAIEGKARKISIVETNKYHQSHHAL